MLLRSFDGYFWLFRSKTDPEIMEKDLAKDYFQSFCRRQGPCSAQLSTGSLTVSTWGQPLVEAWLLFGSGCYFLSSVAEFVCGF
jgi:hypothetical protein